MARTKGPPRDSEMQVRRRTTFCAALDRMSSILDSPASATGQLLVAILPAMPPRPPLRCFPPHGMYKRCHDVPVHDQSQQEVHCVRRTTYHDDCVVSGSSTDGDKAHGLQYEAAAQVRMQCAGCTAAVGPLLTCRLNRQGDIHAAADLPRKGVEIRQPLVLAEALHKHKSAVTKGVNVWPVQLQTRSNNIYRIAKW